MQRDAFQQWETRSANALPNHGNYSTSGTRPEARNDGLASVDSQTSAAPPWALHRDKYPQRHPVACEVDGKVFRGTYWVAGKILTVSTGMGGKSRQVGSMSPETLAKQLLGLMAKDGKA